MRTLTHRLAILLVIIAMVFPPTIAAQVDSPLATPISEEQTPPPIAEPTAFPGTPEESFPAGTNLRAVGCTGSSISVTPGGAMAGQDFILTIALMNPSAPHRVRFGANAEANEILWFNPNGNPNFQGTSQVPIWAPEGSTFIYLVDDAGQECATTSFAVQPLPPLSVSHHPQSGLPGSTVTISMTGWVPHEYIEIYWDTTEATLWDEETIVEDLHADEQGAVTVTITVPNAEPGTYPILIMGYTSGRSSELVYTIPGPTLEITKTESYGGNVVRFTGANYPIGSTVRVTWDTGNGILLARVTASSTGTISGALTIPAAATSGAHVIVASNSATQATATTGYTILSPVVSANPTSGYGGDVVRVTGYGFTPGERVDIRFNGTLVGYVNASSTGTISGVVTVPRYAASGTGTLTARGTTSTRSGSVAYTVLVTPTPALTLAPTSGSHGSTPLVSGQNFQPGERVNITWSNGTLLGYVTVRADGSFSGRVSIPSHAGYGSHAVRATGMSSGKTATSSFSVTTHPTVTVTATPDSGRAGQVITVSGRNYQPGERVVISWHNRVTIGIVTARADGTISGRVTVPATTAPGVYRVIVRGETTGRSAYDVFTVQP